MAVTRNQGRAAARRPRRRRATPPPSRRGRYDRSVSTVERHADQRTKLLDVATEVLALKGFPGTTVEVIVKKAGMSRRTFYEHFDDLRDMLAQLYDRVAVAGFATVERATRAQADGIEQVRAGVTAYLTAVAANPASSKVVFLEYRVGGPDFERRHHRETARYTALLLDAVTNAYNAGTLRKKPTEVAVYVLSRGVEAFAMREIGRGTANRLLELAPEIVDVILSTFDPAPR